MDKGHCMMNMEDEDEYIDFYDFSKTYQNHPNLLPHDISAPITEEAEDIEEEAKEKPAKKGDDDWEDCDFEDIESGDDQA